MKLKKSLRVALSKKLFFKTQFYYLISFNTNYKIITSNAFISSTILYKFPLSFKPFLSLKLLIQSITNFYEIPYCSVNFFSFNYFLNYLYLFLVKSSLLILKFFLKLSLLRY